MNTTQRLLGSVATWAVTVPFAWALVRWAEPAFGIEVDARAIVSTEEGFVVRRAMLAAFVALAVSFVGAGTRHSATRSTRTGWMALLSMAAIGVQAWLRP